MNPFAKRQKIADSNHVLSHGEIVELDLCRFQVDALIATGAESSVYRGRCVSGRHAGSVVAIKSQPRHARAIQVTTEFSTLTDLTRMSRTVPDPSLKVQSVFAYGCHRNSCYVLVTGLLGPSLMSRLAKGGLFDFESILELARQGVPLLQALHRKGYVNRDVKPDNLVLGLPPFDKDLYMIDFGTAEKMFDRHGRRITTPQNVEGTYTFMALSVHRRRPFSPRDDLEAFAWSLLYLYLGRLPWEGRPLAQIQQMKHQVLDRGVAPLLPAEPAPVVDFFARFLAAAAADGPHVHEALRAVVQAAIDIY